MSKNLSMKSKLAITTAMAATLFGGYARRSYAACAITVSPNYLCSGSETTTQEITNGGPGVSDPVITTDGTFSVDTATGDGINVFAFGLASFTDTYGSVIKADAGNGLYIRVSADTMSNPGGVMIDADSDITALTDGISVSVAGHGDIDITFDGKIQSGQNGIYAHNVSYSGDITVDIGSSASVASSASAGLVIDNMGVGQTKVGIAGAVSGYDDGVNVVGYGTDIAVMTYAGSSVYSETGYGIHVWQHGSGNTTITVAGDVESAGNMAIQTYINPTGGDETLIVAKGAKVIATGTGLFGSAIGLQSGSASGGTFVTIEEGASVYSQNSYGIIVPLAGAAGMQIDVYGDISGGAGAIQFGLAKYSLYLNSNAVVNIHGGHVTGDIVDAAPTLGYSTVNIVGEFTSDGNFDTSNFNVAKGAKFTLANGNVIKVNASSTIGVYGEMTVTGTSTLDGNVGVDTTGALNIEDDTSFTGNLKNLGAVTVTGAALDIGTLLSNKAGSISIASDASVTADTMQSGKSFTGTLYFGLASAAQHAVLNITSGFADMTGQTVKVLVDSGDTLVAGDLIKIVDGATTVVGLPASGGETVWDDSSTWDFKLLGGGDVPDDSDLYLLVMAAGSSGGGGGVTAGPLSSGAVAAATMTFADTAMDLTSARLSDMRGDSTGVSAGAPGQNSRVWAQALGQASHQGTRNGIAGYSARLMGGTFGVDTDKYLKNGVLGVAFSYGNSHIDGKNATRDDIDIDSYQLTLYGDYNWPAGWYMAGMGAYAFNSNTIVRHDVGTPGVDASADFNSQQVALRGEMGRVYNAGRAFFTPFALADWTYYTAQSYTETGAGSGNLHVDSKALNQADIGMGMKAGFNMKTANGDLVRPEVHAVYRRDLLGDNLQATNSYVSGGSPSYLTQSPDPAKDKFTLGTQIKYYAADNFELSAAYDVELKQDYTSHTGLIRAGWKF